MSAGGCTALVVAITVMCGHAQPTVQTPCGIYVGVRESAATPNGWASGVDVDVFRGMAYASPPVGPLRWRKPTAPPCLSQQLINATAWSPPCPQADGGDASEDCLAVDVYSKPGAGLGSLLPVFVFIHGGGLISGSASSYNLTSFVGAVTEERGPVVAVSLQYRLGVLGFLASNELLAEQRLGAGNYGIADIVAALRWVRDNIRHFGGDSDRVTVIGQSSGGTAIFALLSSKGLVGGPLFAAAIVLSGSINITMDAGTKAAQDATVVRSLGCDEPSTPEGRMVCLRATPAANVAKALPDNWKSPAFFGVPSDPSGAGYGGVVHVDGAALGVSVPLLTALQQGTSSSVALLVSSMGQEADFAPNDDVRALSADGWRDWLRTRFARWPGNVTALADAIRDAYSSDEAAGGPQRAYDTLSADLGSTCALPSLARAALVVAPPRSAPLYLMSNDWAPAHAINTSGGWSETFAGHMWDLIAAFRLWDYFAVSGGEAYAPEAADEYLGAKLRSAWYDLATVGTIPGWASASAASMRVRAPLPLDMVVNVLSAQGRETVPYFKQRTCRTLVDELGYGPTFWWSD